LDGTSAAEGVADRGVVSGTRFAVTSVQRVRAVAVFHGDHIVMVRVELPDRGVSTLPVEGSVTVGVPANGHLRLAETARRSRRILPANVRYHGRVVFEWTSHPARRDDALPRQVRHTPERCGADTGWAVDRSGCARVAASTLQTGRVCWRWLRSLSGPSCSTSFVVGSVSIDEVEGNSDVVAVLWNHRVDILGRQPECRKVRGDRGTTEPRGHAHDVSPCDLLAGKRCRERLRSLFRLLLGTSAHLHLEAVQESHGRTVFGPVDPRQRVHR